MHDVLVTANSQIKILLFYVFVSEKKNVIFGLRLSFFTVAFEVADVPYMTECWWILL